MKLTTLIPMTDFVNQIGNMENYPGHEKALSWIYNYANFLKQPLKLEMFVPCDEDGNVLDDKGECSCAGNTEWCHGCNSWHYHNDTFTESDAYLKAKEKVLFEGFEMHDNEVINDELERSFFIQDLEFFTIEELEIMSQKKPSLTPTAIQQIQKR